jgi:hypothetical protein
LRGIKPVSYAILRDWMWPSRHDAYQGVCAWLGYLQEYPDYWTQGESLEDLKQHLESLYADLTTGELAGIRKVGELTIS